MRDGKSELDRVRSMRVLLDAAVLHRQVEVIAKGLSDGQLQVFWGDLIRLNFEDSDPFVHLDDSTLAALAETAEGGELRGTVTAALRILDSLEIPVRMEQERRDAEREESSPKGPLLAWLAEGITGEVISEEYVRQLAEAEKRVPGLTEEFEKAMVQVQWVAEALRRQRAVEGARNAAGRGETSA